MQYSFSPSPNKTQSKSTSIMAIPGGDGYSTEYTESRNIPILTYFSQGKLNGASNE